MYYINTLKQTLSIVKTYEHNLLDERYVVDRHWCHIAAKFGVLIDEDHCKLPMLYWLVDFITYPISHVLLPILV